jgi:DNA mismatch repair protein MutS
VSLTCATTRVPPWHFEAEQAQAQLLAHFKTQSLSGFDVDDLPTAICAAGALLRYAARTQSQGLAHIQTLRADRASQYVLMDPATRRNLELTRTLSGEEAPTLFSILDSCRTPMGARLLRRWLHHPLRDNAPVLARQQAIASLMQANDTRSELLHATSVLHTLREALNALPDLERIATRLALLSARPRELASLRDALGALPQLQVQIASAHSGDALGVARLQELAQHLLPPPGMERLLCAAIDAEPAVQVRDGGVIATGYDAELDELRAISTDNGTYLLELEAR